MNEIITAIAEENILKKIMKNKKIFYIKRQF